jgi:DNA-3-methyladenine glycosylase II
MNERGDPVARKPSADSVSKKDADGKLRSAKAVPRVGAKKSPPRIPKRKIATRSMAPKKKPASKRVAKKAQAPAPRTKVNKPRLRYEPGRLIDGEEALAEATQGLRALDADLVGRLIEIGGPTPLRLREPGFAGLASIIVSQQVSVASARAIFDRLETRLAPLDAQTLLAADDDALRAIGLSMPKMRALRALARAVALEGLDLGALGAMDAADAHRALVAVSGIGPWTADIFLLFCLGHPDVFPAGDIALQEAARLALELDARPDTRRLEAIAERWRPWRGVAARMLWAYYRQAKQRSGMALANASG